MLCLWHLFVPDIVRCVWIPDEDGDEGDVVTGVGGHGVLEAEEGGGIGIINVVNIGKQLKKKPLFWLLRNYLFALLKGT